MQRTLLVAGVALAVSGAGCEKLPNVNPTAVFFYTPVSPITAGQTSVRFDASGSRDTDGSIVTYLWNFGDGTAEQPSSDPVTSHVFPDTALRCTQVVYAVSLRTIDDGGASAINAQNISVTEVPAPNSAECSGTGP